MQFAVICLFGLVACASAQYNITLFLGKDITFSLFPLRISKNISAGVSADNRVRRQVLSNPIEDRQAGAGFKLQISDLLNNPFSPSSQPNVLGSEKHIPSKPKPAGLGSDGPKSGVPRSSIREDKFRFNNRILIEQILRNRKHSKSLPHSAKTKSTTDSESTSTQTSSQATTASTTESTDEPADESSTESTTDASTTESNDASTTESNEASTTEPTTDASTSESSDTSTTEPPTEA